MAKSITKLKTHSALPIRNVGEVIHLRLEQIHPSETNPRLYFDEDGMAELANSIKTHGVLQPLLLRPMLGENSMGDYYALVSGERRWRAAKLAGLETVPCYVRQLSETEALEAQIVENLQRLDVTPFEEARGLKVLRDGGQSAAAIAARIGKSPRYVWQSFGLLNLMENETAMKDLAAGTLNRSVALEIASLPSVALVNKAVKELRDWQGNYPPVARVREMIDAGYRRELKGAVFSQTDKKLLPDAGSCKDCPKRTGNNRELYPTGRADICTDIPCFDAKVKAHHKQKLDAFREAGRTVITGKVANQVICTNDQIWHGAQAEWALPTDVCPKDPQERTWGELLKGLAEPCVLQNGAHVTLEAFKLEEVYPLLKEHHGIKPPKAKPASESQTQKRSSSDWTPLDKATKERVSWIRRNATLKALAATQTKLAAMSQGISDTESLATFFHCCVQEASSHYSTSPILQAYLGVTSKAALDGLLKDVSTRNATQWFELYGLMIVAEEAFGWTEVYSQHDLKNASPLSEYEVHPLMKALALDWAGFVEEAEAEYTNQEAA